MMESFFREIPVDLEEAAMVDGDSRFTAFRRIALPLAAPGLAATAIFAVIVTFNEFLFALALTATPARDDHATRHRHADRPHRHRLGVDVRRRRIGALPIVIFALARAAPSGARPDHGRGEIARRMKRRFQWPDVSREESEMINFCLFGAGLIGSVHAGNLARHPKVRLRYIVDPRPEAAERIAAMSPAREIVDTDRLDDPTLDAVMIASATRDPCRSRHGSGHKGKAIFCEKPIDLDIGRTDACLAAVAKAGVIFQIGFNRRFDPSFHALKQRLDGGEIGGGRAGDHHQPRSGAGDAKRRSPSGGGVFREMTIHDFDMARHLLGEEPVEMFATGSSLVSPAYAKLGDYDTAMFVLRTASGRQCHINNSVRASYGYDQRIEVHGSEGMLRAGNRMPTSVALSNGEAVSVDKPLYFFVERYAESYAAELDHFVDLHRNRRKARCRCPGWPPRDDLVRGRPRLREVRPLRAGPISECRGNS